MYTRIAVFLVLVIALLFMRWWAELLGKVLHKHFGLACGAVGWPEGQPHQCQHPKWHRGSHASAWWRSEPDTQRRARWYDGELGQSSSIETRRYFSACAVWLCLLVSTGCANDGDYWAPERAACRTMLHAARTSADTVVALAAHPADERGVTCALLLTPRDSAAALGYRR